MKIKLSKVYSNLLPNIETPLELARQLRRADDFIRLGVCAGFETLRLSDDEQYQRTPESIGIIFGTVFGPMETNFDVLDQVVDPEPVSPTMFSHSVFNSAAGYMANTLKIEGCALTVTDFSFPFFQALEQGILAILDGTIESCLVLQVETYSRLIQDVKNSYGSKSAEWPAGVTCWLIEKSGARRLASECFSIESLEVRSQLDMNHEFLNFQEELIINNESIVCEEPLESVMELTKRINVDSNIDHLDCIFNNPFGTVKITLQR